MSFFFSVHYKTFYYILGPFLKCRLSAAKIFSLTLGLTAFIRFSSMMCILRPSLNSGFTEAAVSSNKKSKRLRNCLIVWPFNLFRFLRCDSFVRIFDRGLYNCNNADIRSWNVRLRFDS